MQAIHTRWYEGHAGYTHRVVWAGVPPAMYPGSMGGVYLLLCTQVTMVGIHLPVHSLPVPPWVYPPSSPHSVSTTANDGCRQWCDDKTLGSPLGETHGWREERLLGIPKV